MSYGNIEETAFFTMRKVFLRIFMVKLCQGRREGSLRSRCDMQTPYRHRALHGPNFATLSLSRGRVRMTHNRMGTSSRGMFPCSLCLHGKRGVRIMRRPLAYLELILVRLHALNGAVLVVLDLTEHNTTLMVYTAGQGRVVVEQVPLIIPLYDGVVGGPTDNRL